MTKYQKQKERARDKAIVWQHEFADTSLSMLELAKAGNYFAKLGKRYGLTREFRENGII